MRRLAPLLLALLVLPAATGIGWQAADASCCNGTICVRAFLSAHCDGCYSPWEDVGLEGVVVRLHGPLERQPCDRETWFEVTDENGLVCPEGFAPGEWEVSIPCPPPYCASSVLTRTVLLQPCGVARVAFGFCDCAPPPCKPDCPPDVPCGECAGKVTVLQLRYLGESAADVLVEQKKGSDLFSAVQPNQVIEVRGRERDGTLGTNISLFVDGAESAKIHTSCSRPIGPGQVYGDFQIVYGESLKGGPLCPLLPPPPSACGNCKGKVTSLTLELGGATARRVRVEQKKGRVVVFDGLVGPGEPFSFSGSNKDGTLGTSIAVYLDGVLDTEIHTSCSQPIGPGMVRGSFLIVAGTSLKGGPLCPLPPGPPQGCGACRGRVTTLTLVNDGEGGNITVTAKKGHPPVFTGFVPSGGEFSFSGNEKDGTLGTEIQISRNGRVVQAIHTSCSKPIGVGMVFGDFEVLAGASKDGGPLCPIW